MAIMHAELDPLQPDGGLRLRGQPQQMASGVYTGPVRRWFRSVGIWSQRQ